MKVSNRAPLSFVGKTGLAELSDTVEELGALPLNAWHCARGARMVPFAGYSMPLLYDSIVSEHHWTRNHASLFDVSHMGQILVKGDGVTPALERLLPADLIALKPDHLRYSLLLNELGGIRDDLIVTRVSDGPRECFLLVVNGATKMGDIAHLRTHLPDTVSLEYSFGRALLALQGPEAKLALDALFPGIAGELGFMRATLREWEGYLLGISRSGYTGEDGFEISLPAQAVAQFADALLIDERVKPAGLGARDSLRLEAGLPLYGHDLHETTDPISADLSFALSRRRKAEGGFLGAGTIAGILAKGPSQIRVGLTLEGRLPAREGAPVFSSDHEIGRVSSGGFSPTLGAPIAMAYIDVRHSAPGTSLEIEVRGRRLEAAVTPLPFVPHKYHRAGASK